VEEVTPSEPTGVGAGLVLDKHLLTDGSRDQDYNGAGELTFSGLHAHRVNSARPESSSAIAPMMAAQSKRLSL
jgi:hypothetical protein